MENLLLTFRGSFKDLDQPRGNDEKSLSFVPFKENGIPFMWKP